MDELKMQIKSHALDCILTERRRQEEREWKDEFNSEGLWASYISNYASRWAMPTSFDPEKYSFRECMIKTAALALAAIEWNDTRQELPDSSMVLEVSENSINRRG
uniref:Uncharacterized protein n=1 Tax=viral metagenome TaxID=1070528 RepID=A0A6M3LFT0_9ZZZZ